MSRLVLLALATFVLFLSTLVGQPVIPELAARLGADPTATAATLSAALMTTVLLQFLSGGLADRYGRRPVLVAGALAGGLTSLGCALAGGWRELLAMRVLGGVADAVALPALLGLTAELGQGRHGTFFGVLRSAQGLSFMVGPAIGGALSVVSLRAPFVADAALSVGACVLLVRLVPSRSLFDRTGRGEDGASAVAAGHSWAQIGRLRALFVERRYWAYALFVAVDNVAFPVLAAFVPVVARMLGAAPSDIGLMMAVQAACFSLACWLAGRLSDRLGRRPLVIAAQPVVMAGCVGVALATSWPGMMGWLALYGLGAGLTFVLGLVMAADITPAADAAGTLGAFDAAVDLLIFAAPAVALAVYEQIGRTTPILLGAALPALIALPVALLTRETRQTAALRVGTIAGGR